MRAATRKLGLFARPKNRGSDTHIVERSHRTFVALDIAGYFGIPELRVSFWPLTTPAAVAVPIASVHKNRHLQPSDIYVRAAGQIFPVQAVADTMAG